MPPSLVELEAARELAGRLMKHEVAPLESYLAVMSIQPAAIMVFKERGRVTGVISALFLKECCLAPILDGSFDAVSPGAEQLSAEGEAPALLYSWGIAAETKPAAAAILRVGADVTRLLYPEIPAFTRAVTADGRRTAGGRYGYRPLRHPDDDLFARLPGQMEQAA